MKRDAEILAQAGPELPREARMSARQARYTAREQMPDAARGSI